MKCSLRRTPLSIRSRFLIPLNMLRISAEEGGSDGSRAFEPSDADRRRSDVVAAIIYSAAAVAVLVHFRLYYFWIPDSWASNWPQIASLLAAGLFAVTAIRVFAARKFADLTALIGALLAWLRFVPTMLNRYFFSPGWRSTCPELAPICVALFSSRGWKLCSPVSWLPRRLGPSCV